MPTFVEVPPEEQAYARFLHSMQQAGTLITGLALKAIRDHEVYKKLGCTSFKDYCDTMASVTRMTAYRHIKRAEMYGAFLPDVFSPQHFAQLQSGQGGSPLLQLTSALQGDGDPADADSTPEPDKTDSGEDGEENAEDASTTSGPIPRAINGLSGSKLDALGELDDERLRDYITHEKLHTPDGDVITREQIAEMTAREVSRRVGEILEPHKKKAETEKEKRLKAEAERDALKDTLDKKEEEIERSRDIEHTLGPRAARLEEKRDRMSKMEDALREASKQIYKIGLTTDDPIPDQERAMDILAHCQRLADAAREELGDVVLNAELRAELERRCALASARCLLPPHPPILCLPTAAPSPQAKSRSGSYEAWPPSTCRARTTPTAPFWPTAFRRSDGRTPSGPPRAILRACRRTSVLSGCFRLSGGPLTRPKTPAAPPRPHPSGPRRRCPSPKPPRGRAATPPPAN